MSDRLRVIRDQIERGDDVLVLGHGPKPRAARVVEVLRAAVRIRYDDAPSSHHTVMLKQVQRVELVEQQRPAAERPSTTRVKPTTATTATLLLPPPSLAAESPPPPSAAPPLDTDSELESKELGAWLEMGHEVKARIVAELDAVTAQLQAVAADIVHMQAELAELERRKHTLAARVARFDTVLKW